MADKPHYEGHRARLRERFLLKGADALADYELLELVLFGARPRGDVKPLAKDLIAKFGSFAEVISAPVERLRDIEGIGDTTIATLKSVQAASLKLMQQQVMHQPVLSSWNALIDYCRAAMGYGKKEQFRILFLDRKNRLIADELQQEGTVDHTPVYPREVAKRALEHGASAIILVHNHPSGDPKPSKADIAMTKDILKAAGALDISVHDHVIVTRGDHVSFKSLGLI